MLGTLLGHARSHKIVSQCWGRVKTTMDASFLNTSLVTRLTFLRYTVNCVFIPNLMNIMFTMHMNIYDTPIGCDI